MLSKIGAVSFLSTQDIDLQENLKAEATDHEAKSSWSHDTLSMLGWLSKYEWVILLAFTERFPQDFHAFYQYSLKKYVS